MVVVTHLRVPAKSCLARVYLNSGEVEFIARTTVDYTGIDRSWVAPGQVVGTQAQFQIHDTDRNMSEIIHEEKMGPRHRSRYSQTNRPPFV